MATKQACELTLSKNGLDVVLQIKVAEEIENYFRDVSKARTEQSSKWLDKDNNGLTFYEKAEVMSRKVNNLQVIDNFGNGLFHDGKINVALVRCVGASKGITIKTNDLLSYSEMERYIRELANWVKGFYEEQLRPAQVNAVISLEV